MSLSSLKYAGGAIGCISLITAGYLLSGSARSINEIQPALLAQQLSSADNGIADSVPASLPTVAADSELSDSPNPKKATATTDKNTTVAEQARALLDRMAFRPLPSESELAELQDTANSAVFQDYLFSILAGHKEFVFDFAAEKLRFQHQDYLKDVYRYGNSDTRERIAAQLEEIIFSTSYLDTPDMKLRQSLAGDKVDYLRFTRDNYPNLFARLKARIEGMDDPLLSYCLNEV